MEKYQSLVYFAAFLTAFLITFFSIPAIIRLSLVKKLYDQPDQRKHHSQRISPLGGIAIFGGLLLSFVFFTAHLANATLNSVLVALIILFITGVKDDLYPLVPYKKLLGQLMAVGVVVIQGDIRLVQLYGLFNIYELPYWSSLSLSFLFFIGIINSFNFIDGINGLSSLLSILVSTVYTFLFIALDQALFITLSLCIIGAQLAFLPYNLLKAKIFMGDTGSMIMGFFAALLSIYFLQTNALMEDQILEHIDAMLFAFAILILPILDSARVVFIRVFIKKVSPLKADRNHLHHVLLDIGLSHWQATLWLIGTNTMLIALSWFLNPHIRASLLFSILVVLALGLSQVPFLIKQKLKRLGRYPL
ncbi:MAG: undecaprenyl/decaprenyl-phosphate alpha-N-acetylglucosaminyl 1-phosphate transferase [Bacteroidetes bacterium]|nr:undecaprenyl/decaprenyl-phosphate alpha-N-acetylglucosaminyl 1-phosphate transferase [Bacteroidota bacterium]